MEKCFGEFGEIMPNSPSFSPPIFLSYGIVCTTVHSEIPTTNGENEVPN